jgi:enamine deaminase RidA (YjgF/YER057c/UK114 family)
MSKESINPQGLAQPKGPYSNVTVAPAGGKLVFSAGSVAFDESGEIVGVGDIVAQAEQVMRNLKLALEARGASFEDVTKITMYAVDVSDYRGGGGTPALPQGTVPGEHADRGQGPDVPGAAEGPITGPVRRRHPRFKRARAVRKARRLAEPDDHPRLRALGVARTTPAPAPRSVAPILAIGAETGGNRAVSTGISTPACRDR